MQLPRFNLRMLLLWVGCFCLFIGWLQPQRALLYRIWRSGDPPGWYGIKLFPAFWPHYIDVYVWSTTCEEHDAIYDEWRIDWFDGPNSGSERVWRERKK